MITELRSYVCKWTHAKIVINKDYKFSSFSGWKLSHLSKFSKLGKLCCATYFLDNYFPSEHFVRRLVQSQSMEESIAVKQQYVVLYMATIAILEVMHKVSFSCILTSPLYCVHN